MLHIHFVKVDHESLLVIGSLGIQVSSSYASGRETTRFIEMSKIKDIVINEAIYMVLKETYFTFSTCVRMYIYVIILYSHDSCSSLYLCNTSELIFNILISASDHLLPLCTIEGLFWPKCSVKFGAIVSGNHYCKSNFVLIFSFFSSPCIKDFHNDNNNANYNNNNDKEECVSNEYPSFIFQSSKPRLDCLVKVYKSCQEILSKCWWLTKPSHTLCNVSGHATCFSYFLTKVVGGGYFGSLLIWFNALCIILGHYFICPFLFSPVCLYTHRKCECNLLDPK